MRARLACMLLPGLVALAGCDGSAPDTAPERPDVVLITIDTLRADHLGAYGHFLDVSPNIDQLAKDGMIFQRCYTTNSICGPMRAVIQTGKYSHKNGFMVNGNKFDGNQQTFPKLLRKAGYTTAVVGKWHLGTHMAPQGYEVLVPQEELI